MQAERSKIMSGRLVANGRFLYSGDPKLNGEGRISWKHVFDYADDYFLFDRSEPRRPDYPPFDGDVRLRTFFAEDRDASYAYQNRVAHEAILRVYGRDDRNNAPGNRFKRLNVRGIGFYNGPNMLAVSEKGDRIFFEHSYVTKFGSEIKVEQESENILKLWFNDPGEPDGPDADKSCLWVDKSRGFIPIRAASTTNGEISMDSRTEWKNIDQVWVPTRLTGNSRVASLPDGAEDIEDIEYEILEFELDITWESLNENVGTGKLHDLREFDLPKGTRALKGRNLVHIYGYELPVRRPAGPKPAARVHISAQDVLAVWAETTIDPVSIAFTTKTDERRREMSDEALARALDSGETDLGGEPQRNSFREQWKLLRDTERGALLRRTGGTSPANPGFHPAWGFFKGEGRSLYAGSGDSAVDNDVLFATRRNDAPVGLQSLLIKRLLLDWIDPRSTHNGERFASLGNIQLEMVPQEDGGGVISVALTPERTVWYAEDFDWRPVRETLTRAGQPLSEIDYQWKRENGQTILVRAESREQKPGSREFCNISLSVENFSLSPIADEALVIEFPPKTVVLDSRAEERRHFVVTATGIEREVDREEMSLAGPSGWSAIVGRDEPPGLVGDSANIGETQPRVWVAALALLVFVLFTAVCIIAYRSRRNIHP